jgi:hypothetical protein
MTVVYPALDSPEFNHDLTATRQAFDTMTSLFDRLGIDRRDRQSTDDAAVAAFETVVPALNELLERFSTLRAYVYSFVATDSRNDQAQATFSMLMREGVRLTKLLRRLTAWLGGLDVETLIQRSTIARDHAYLVRRAAEEARAPDVASRRGTCRRTGPVERYRLGAHVPESDVADTCAHRTRGADGRTTDDSGAQTWRATPTGQCAAARTRRNSQHGNARRCRSHRRSTVSKGQVLTLSRRRRWGVTARGVAVRQWDRPRHARCNDDCRARVLSRLPALPARQSQAPRS